MRVVHTDHVVQLPVSMSGALAVDGSVTLVEGPTNAVFMRNRIMVCLS